MAKRGRPKKIGAKPPKARKAKPNGQGALEVAPKVAARDIPAGDEAAEALKVLADMNDKVKRCEAIEQEAKAAHDEAKGELKSAQKALSDELWKRTHRADMPLFDASQAEADLSRIQEQAAGSVLEGAGEAAGVPPLTLPAADAAQATSDVPIIDPEPF